MPGTNQVNRKRANIQRLHRVRRAARKQSKAATQQTNTVEAMMLTNHQKKMLRSNPNANFELSNKKKRRLYKKLLSQNKMDLDQADMVAAKEDKMDTE